MSARDSQNVICITKAEGVAFRSEERPDAEDCGVDVINITKRREKAFGRDKAGSMPRIGRDVCHKNVLSSVGGERTMADTLCDGRHRNSEDAPLKAKRR